MGDASKTIGFRLFIELSKIIGSREDLVQAGGGNTSYKFGNNLMCVKSSGIHLSELKEDFGYSIVELNTIKLALDNGETIEHNALLDRCLVEGKRASIETFFHSITMTYTFHMHPTLVNIIAARSNGLEIFKSLFEDALTIEYFTPGWDLSLVISNESRMYFNQYRKFGKCNTFIDTELSYRQ